MIQANSETQFKAKHRVTIKKICMNTNNNLQVVKFLMVNNNKPAIIATNNHNNLHIQQVVILIITIISHQSGDLPNHHLILKFQLMLNMVDIHLLLINIITLLLLFLQIIIHKIYLIMGQPLLTLIQLVVIMEGMETQVHLIKIKTTLQIIHTVHHLQQTEQLMEYLNRIPIHLHRIKQIVIHIIPQQLLTNIEVHK